MEKSMDLYKELCAAAGADHVLADEPMRDRKSVV